MQRIAVFCVSSAGNDPVYRELARQTAGALVERKLGLVYGGGSCGIMGELANEVLARGGDVIGVIPQRLVIKEVVHEGLSDLRVVQSMHERKALMAELSDGFIALPGGMGTLEELFEILTWAQLGIHQKPCGLVDVKSYFRPLTEFLDRVVSEGFLRPQYRNILMEDTHPGRLLDRFAEFRATPTPKYMELEET